MSPFLKNFAAKQTNRLIVEALFKAKSSKPININNFIRINMNVIDMTVKSLVVDALTHIPSSAPLINIDSLLCEYLYPFELHACFVCPRFGKLFN